MGKNRFSTTARRSRSGEILYEKDFYSLGLRLPGHGRIPEALTEVDWNDWIAASRIAARHVRERIGPDKIFIMWRFRFPPTTRSMDHLKIPAALVKDCQSADFSREGKPST